MFVIENEVDVVALIRQGYILSLNHVITQIIQIIHIIIPLHFISQLPLHVISGLPFLFVVVKEFEEVAVDQPVLVVDGQLHEVVEVPLLLQVEEAGEFDLLVEEEELVVVEVLLLQEGHGEQVRVQFEFVVCQFAFRVAEVVQRNGVKADYVAEVTFVLHFGVEFENGVVLVFELEQVDDLEVEDREEQFEKLIFSLYNIFLVLCICICRFRWVILLCYNSRFRFKSFLLIE